MPTGVCKPLCTCVWSLSWIAIHSIFEAPSFTEYGTHPFCYSDRTEFQGPACLCPCSASITASIFYRTLGVSGTLFWAFVLHRLSHPPSFHLFNQIQTQWEQSSLTRALKSLKRCQTQMSLRECLTGPDPNPCLTISNYDLVCPSRVSLSAVGGRTGF